MNVTVVQFHQLLRIELDGSLIQVVHLSNHAMVFTEFEAISIMAISSLQSESHEAHEEKVITQLQTVNVELSAGIESTVTLNDAFTSGTLHVRVVHVNAAQVVMTEDTVNGVQAF